MKLIDQKIVTKVYGYETFDVGDGFTLKIDTEDGEITKQFMPYSGDVSEVSVYSYVKDIENFKKLCMEHHFYDTVKKDPNYWWQEYLTSDYLKEFGVNGFNPDNVILVKCYDHTILDAKGKRFDILRHSDYIGGFKNSDLKYETQWRWNELKEHMRNHSDVLNLEIKEIPYYNSDFEGQEGMDFDFIFKSEWSKYVTKDNSWRDIVIGSDTFDPLNVNQFKIK